jgi:SAM-dependent methyltransferase
LTRSETEARDAVLGMTIASIWQDVECGYYTADLQLWEELSHRGDSVLDLGCGNGRVAMHLARRGRKVTGLDTEKRLLEVLEARAAQCALTVDTVCADARGFDLGVQFDAVFAPMHLVQLLEGSAGRKAMLVCVARHLRPGGVFAATLMNLEGELVGDEYGPPRPDVQEVNEWVFSSQSLAANVVERGRAMQIDRLRTAVSPEGKEHTTFDEVRLELVSPALLEREVVAAGMDIQERRRILPTEHVGSVVVIARLPDRNI